jgi:enoyl-CoA hydratase/carnithine racemase
MSMSERQATAAKTSTAEEPLLTLDRPRPGVAVLTLNRPAARNALSLAMLDALHKAFDTLGTDTSVAAIVLAANGPVFSSGHDLKELTAHRADADKGLAFYGEAMTRCSAMMQAMRDQPQIIIASVEGVASAAGCQLVASADLAIASSEARFATPGVNIGLWCLTPMVALSRTVTPKHAMQMLTTGRLYDAEFALRIGLVNEVVAPEQLADAVKSMAAEIASKSTYTLALGKQAFYRQLQMPVSDAYEYSGELVVRNMAHADAREGINAFVEKRKPVWVGRK